MPRTKIVATLGPASQEHPVIDSILDAGADLLRLNFAHSDPATHRATAARVRDVAAEKGRVVGLLADLPGPKMRTGPLLDGEVSLEPGRHLRLVAGAVPGDGAVVGTNVGNLADLVAPGDEVFLADGQVILRVAAVEPDSVLTEVVRGGVLRSGKGLHIPGAELKVQAFTERDREALEVALAIGVDFVGLSFVRSARDIETVRERLPAAESRPALVAKVETRQAVENLDEIVRAADAVMVARGDLGIQLPFRKVPLLQKEIIRACNGAGTPVITATQMLESMTRSPLPTRAEVNDVANAVIDGTDAVMLSEETAVGDYPVGAVRIMAEIVEEAESATGKSTASAGSGDDEVSWAIAEAAVQAAGRLGVAAILCPTRSGATARRVAAFRPDMPILAIDHSSETLRRLAVVWGVIPFEVPFLPEDELAARGLDRALNAARDSGVAEKGDLVTLVAGGSEPRAGSTDLMRVLRL